MFVTDTLSRAYLLFKASTDEQELADDINVLVHSLLSDYPASVKKMDQLREQTASDPELSQLLLCLRNGFEAGDNLPQNVQHYRKFADEMYELDGLLFMHGRLGCITKHKILKSFLEVSVPSLKMFHIVMCSMLHNITKLSCHLGGPPLAEILHIGIVVVFRI